MEDYRAPTPATLQGAAVLSTAQALAHWQQHDAVFIDVLPQVPRPVGLPASTIWREKTREDLPGSIWLPDTGYGELAPVMKDTSSVAWPSNRRRSRPHAGVLLSSQLLDVLERGETCHCAGLYTRPVVSGWHRRMGCRSSTA